MRAISTIQTISIIFVETVQPQAENYKPYKPVNNNCYPSANYISMSFFFFLYGLQLKKTITPAVAENVGEGGGGGDNR